MTRTLLVLGPVDAGRSRFIETLPNDHPDHRWHLVRMEGYAGQQTCVESAAPSPGWAGAWILRYRAEEVLTALPELVERIRSDLRAQPSVIVCQAAPDPLLRHAHAFDLQVFILSPNDDESVLFRSDDEARLALREILRDSSTFSAQVQAAGQEMADGDQAIAAAMPDPGGAAEMNESQVEGFLAQPLGMELAMRVHLQPRFSAMADADIIILDVSAAESCPERNLPWQRLLGLLGRVRKHRGRHPLTYACDLSDPEDPCLVRIRRRMSERLCKV